jgi:glycine/D-amino acid oxidase-like deaminating enzyme
MPMEMSSKLKRIFHSVDAVTQKKNHSVMAPTAKPDSKPNNSLWADNLTQSVKEFAPNNSYDVLIIGGGFSGLWSAYHLKKLNPRLSIAIFEAQHCGYGASGRNGGWASSDYPVYRSTLEKRYGIEITQTLFDSLIGAIDEIGEIASSIAPQANFVKSGTVMFARNQAQERRLKSSEDELHQWKSAEELREMIRVSDARGGLFNSECATVNPMGLVSGLVSFLINKGVSIFENVFATRVESGVLANSVFVHAPVVIQATEVFSEPGRDFIPLYSLMIATEPLADDIWSQIGVNSRFTFAEGSHLINYAQRTSDNRIALGGRGATYPLRSQLQSGKESTPQVHEHLRELVQQWFPVLRGVRFTHSWGGAVAITRDWEPYVQFNPHSGFGRLGGYAGDGVTMSYLAAKILAHLIENSSHPITNLHFVNRRIRQWEPEPLRYIAVNSLVKLSGFADKEEKLSARPSVVSKIIAQLILR